MEKKVNWTKMKTEYISTNISYVKLSKKYDVYLEKIKRMAKKEKWTEKRKIAKAKTDAKIEEKVIDMEVDRNTRHIKLIDKVLDAVEKVISEELNKTLDMFGNLQTSPIINHSKLAKIMETLDKAQKGHRLAEGLDKDKGKDGAETNGFEDEFSELIDK